MTHDDVLTALGLSVVAAPAALVAALGLSTLIHRPLNERTISCCTQAAVVAGLLAAVAILALMLAVDTRHVSIGLGNWVVIPEQHFHFTVKLVFDRLSVPFVLLSFLLCGTISAFTSKYLHREPGYGRFFALFALFLLGMVLSSLAGTIETLFIGWELVGLSSALLVGFFHERTAPVRNGLRVWAVYRISDAAFLIAAVALHHLTGEGDFYTLMGSVPWPDGNASLTENQALFVGALLVIAAAGKSALVPFSGWLPRAMEGPTPSSAVFYGALSAHLGVVLLLRVGPILELSPWLGGAVVALGLLTALFAAITARVQTDIKSALAFASLTQIGIIVAEIGFGLRYVALIHLIGHACLRTLQFLRAPTLLHDYHTLENAIGAHLPRRPAFWKRALPDPARRWLYRFALERGYLDALLSVLVVRPFVRLFQACDALERKWTDFLSGGQSRESDRVKPSPEVLEELQ
jgi:NAD(P)H-quinone oxidoreductase subunit 5